MKVAIIGAGNMGGATARGMAQGTQIKTSDITVSDMNEQTLAQLKSEYPEIRTTTSNVECVAGADLVIVVVKPWLVERVVAEIRPVLDYSKVIFASIAGGVGVETLAAYLDRGDGAALPPVYHIIPNTAIAFRQSMTFIAPLGTKPSDDKLLLDIFNELGTAMLIEDRLMGAGMALASCGIAYAFRYVRAATEGGVELGLYPKAAQQIVEQTLLGAVAVLRANGSHPEQEIDKVTTPGGFTIKGLNTMEANGFTRAVIEGLKASC